MGVQRKVLVGNPEGKGPLGRRGLRWEDGIRMELREIGWGCRVNSVGSEYGTVVGSCECGDEPSGSDTTEIVS
jgi:hypothetical protein